jgi:uncharacterized damage-inducible protein DinB
MSAAINAPHRPSTQPARASAAETLRVLASYKKWANGLTYRQVMALPEGEALKQRQTRFGNMVHTLNHVFVVDDIFRHHMEGRKHGYTSRNTDTTPPIAELWAKVQEMDQWYVDQVQGWTDEDLATVIRFEFVGGGEGAMTREEIVLHVVNHATYHRGFVGDMMYQVPVMPESNDLPVFIRDVWKKGR